MGFYRQRYGFTPVDLQQQDTLTQVATETLMTTQYCSQGGAHLVGTSGVFSQRWLTGPCQGMPAVAAGNQQQAAASAASDAASAVGGKSWRVFVRAPGALSLNVREWFPPGPITQMVPPEASYMASAAGEPGLFVFSTRGIKPDGTGTNRAYVRFIATYPDGQTAEAPLSPLAAGSSPVKAGFPVGDPGVYRIAKKFSSNSPLKPSAFANGAPSLSNGNGNGNGDGNGDGDDTYTYTYPDYENDVGFLSNLSTPAKVGIAAGVGVGLFALIRALR
jgi:hypothetical protein